MSPAGLRSALGLTQPQFALLLGVSASTVSRWERPGAASPDSLQRDLVLVLAKLQAELGPAAFAALGVDIAQALALGGTLRGLWVVLGRVHGPVRPAGSRYFPRRPCACSAAVSIGGLVFAARYSRCSSVRSASVTDWPMS